MGLTIDPNQIKNIEGARQAILELFNMIEELQQENVKLRTENQRLRDENNRLKGEQGKPDIKPDKKPKAKTIRPKVNAKGLNPIVKNGRIIDFVLTGSKSYQSIKVGCRPMLNSRDMKRWWCKISGSRVTTFGS